MENNPADPRILRLELLTAAQLKRMKDFYHRLLGIEVLDDRPKWLTIAAGLSRITFFTAKPEDGKPFYHFAFNIPENKILAARTWQKERTSLLPIPARLRDPAYPADVVRNRPIPRRSGYYIGMLVAQQLAKKYTFAQMCRLAGPHLRAEI